MTEIGHLGEQLVAQWLKQQGWVILQQQWRSRWGEIDLIAHSRQTQILAFVEVKTRSQGNWDEGGQLAVNATKQRKILLTANAFLARYPSLADFPCRFDVALVHCQKIRQETAHEPRLTSITMGQTLIQQGYQLTLQNYLESAFEA
ncbi:MAG: YraN family protein [Snowella sp.]|nr:YraN family protein [Snowella sp.]